MTKTYNKIMKTIRTFLLVLLIVLISCVPQSDSQYSNDKIGSEPTNPISSLLGSLSLVDGTRLESRIFKGSDGSITYAGVWDKELEVFCNMSFSYKFDKRRCYPQSSNLIYYKNPDCSDNGFMISGNSSPSFKTFWDPFCGSGTLPIEAAMIAMNIAPHARIG